MTLFLLLLAAYLIGSIPFAIIVSRFFRLEDPRKFGSGNPGATNVLRAGNKAAAGLTLAGDCAKGWFVVWAAGALGFSATAAALAGLAAFIGHILSIFLKFKGGKGVATALGVLAGIHMGIALFSMVVWALVAYFTRYSSVAALAATAAAPLGGFIFLDNAPVIGILMAMAAALVMRHSDNVRKIKAGKEPRIGEKH